MSKQQMFFWENGFNLGERLVPQSLSNAATAAVEALNLNSISERSFNGRRAIVKSRNAIGEKMANLANAYFRRWEIPIRFLSKVDDWRRRELESFNLLNGDRFRARAPDARTIIEDKLPGESIWVHMKRGTLTVRMLEAAGREFRRAHCCRTGNRGGLWSHADATTTNVIYESRTGRARLVDFEIVHVRSLPARVRHADDLLVFLLDLSGVIPARQWLSFALHFLNAYGDGEVLAALRERLVLPGGLAWIWWEVRTNFAAPAKVKRRLARLRKAVGQMELYRAVRARARQKRRPSIHCQQRRPGTPRASSRTLPIKERAKASSPGMPRRPPTKR
jgi:hypothetical protein